MYEICIKRGKVHQVVREMKRLRLASETRWTGAGKVHLTTGEMVLYCDLAGDDAPHEKGVALILSKEAAKSLKQWEQDPMTAPGNTRFETRSCFYFKLHRNSVTPS